MAIENSAEVVLKKLGSLYQAIGDAVELVDADGKIVFANAALVEMHGYAEDELIGKLATHLTFSDNSPTSPAPLKLPFDVVWVGKVKRIHKSGEVFDAHLTSSPVKNSKGNTIGRLDVVIERGPHYVTDNVGVARRSTDEALAEIGRIFSSSLNTKEVFQRFADVTQELVPLDNISICTVDEVQRIATTKYASGPDLSGRKEGDTFDLAGTVVEEVFDTRSSVLLDITDANADEVIARYPALDNGVRSGMRTLMGVPLISNGRVDGVMLARSCKLGTYSADQLSIFERVGVQIAGAISISQHHAQLHKRVKSSDAIAGIGLVVASSPEIEDTYGALSEQIKKHIPFDCLIITTVDKGEMTARISHVVGEGGDKYEVGQVIKIEESFAADMVRTKSTIVFNPKSKAEIIEKCPYLLSSYEIGIRSYLAVPLLSKDEVVGLMSFRSSKANAYSEHELSLATEIGAQIAGAVASARLRAQRELEVKERETLAEIGRVISSSPDIDEVFERFVDHAQRLFLFDRIAINTIDQELGMVSAIYSSGLTVKGRHRGDVFPLSGTTMETMISENSGVLVQGLGNEELIEKYPELSNGLEAGLQSYITVPLRSRDRIMGALLIRSKSWNAYSSHDLQLAEMLGDQIAGVIANAELHKDIERRAAEQHALAKIGRIISGSIVIDEVYESFAVEVKKVLPCDRISISLLHPDGTNTTHSYVSGLDTREMTKGSIKELGGTMAEDVVSSRSAKIFVFDDINEYSRRFPGRSPMFELGIRSHVFAPLIANDKVIGLFYAGSKKSDAYDELDRQLAEQIGNQIAGAIANSRLHATLERDAAERQVLADIGRTMSSSLVIGEVLEQFAELANRVVPFDKIAVAVIDWDRQMISNLHHYGDTVEGRSFGDETPLKGTTVEEAVKRDSGVIIPDMPPEEVARLYPGTAAGVEVGFRSFMTVPLRSRDKIIGAIVMRAYRPLAFDQRDLDLAERMADQIAGTVDGSQLYLALQKTEEALKESLDRFDLAIKGSGDGLWDRVISTREHHGDYFDEQNDCVYFSPRFKGLLGYEDHEFPNDIRKWIQTIHPDDLTLIRQAVKDHIEHNKPYKVEYRAQTKSGEYRWFRSLGQALWDESGRPIRMIGFLRDVTNEKSLETQLLRSQKMDAFGQLAGGLAHDLNNMLSVVMSYTHLAKTAKTSETRELHLGEVLKASERAAELISQLLTFSRRQIIEPRTVDLNDVVVDVERMLRRLMGEEIRLVTKLDPEVWLVEVDPGQIEQVLVNLSVNSRDAMPDGGTLLIETSSEAIDEERAKEMGELIPGAYTVITVQDTGTGIPEEIKDQVFEPFFTTKEVGQGSGLGLSTCYGIVAQSGGYIVLESVVGEGCTFKIYLPAKDGPLESLPVRGQSGSLPVGTESILIVEDEPLVRNVAVHVLKEQGYTIIEASNGLEALDVASQHRGGRVDLLLTDMVMPVMGGRKLAERLKELHPDLKVLFTSGYTEDDAFKEEVLNERTNFLPKPFNPDTLTRKVREALQDGADGYAEEDLSDGA